MCSAEKKRKSFHELATHCLIMLTKINKNVKFQSTFLFRFQHEMPQRYFLPFESFLSSLLFLFYFSMTSPVHLFRLFLLHNLNKIQIFLLISFCMSHNKRTLTLFYYFWKRMEADGRRQQQMMTNYISLCFLSFCFIIFLFSFENIFSMLIFQVA